MPKVTADELKIQELLTRAVEKIFPSKEILENKLRSGQRFSVYLGIDPTGPDLHLGHSVQILALKRFQALGHKAVIVIGDFTARIGDPTGKDLTRRPLSDSEVKENARNYRNQISKILNAGKIDFKWNNDWLGKLTFKEVVKLTSFKTVQQLLDRDMFQKRIEKGEAIGVHEFLYPLMQGYDSVAIEIDGEIGGSDQTFNMLVGRDLEKAYLNKEKFVFSTRLLINPATGQKIMSKTAGDYIPLSASPQEMYSKVMALPDEMVFEMFELCTELPTGEIDTLKSGNIRAAKQELALEITKIYHGEKEAVKAGEEFRKVFSQKQIPSKIDEFGPDSERRAIKHVLIDSKIAESSSEAKRLLDQNGVKINDSLIKDINYQVKDGDIIQVGPHRFLKIK